MRVTTLTSDSTAVSSRRRRAPIWAARREMVKTSAVRKMVSNLSPVAKRLGPLSAQVPSGEARGQQISHRSLPPCARLELVRSAVDHQREEQVAVLRGDHGGGRHQ